MKNNRGGQKFDDFRQLYFDEIAYDKGLMFNFFLKHNDIFQRIEKDDEDILIVIKFLNLYFFIRKT